MHTNNPSQVRSTKVVIIGAGISGLSASKTFSDKGFNDFVLLEAQDYAGGRIKTLLSNNGIIELGAQWLHGTENELYSFCKKNGLLSDIVSTEGKGKFFKVDGEEISDELVEKIESVVGEILTECERLKSKHEPNISVGRYLQKEFMKVVSDLSDEDAKYWKLVFNWHLKFQHGDNCCDLSKLSAKHWGDYDFNGDCTQSHINFKNGYSSVVEKILGSLPEGNVYFNKPVENICWLHNDESPIKVICKDGFTIHCEFVICSVSLGVLKATHEQMFSPELPQNITQAINCLGFGDIVKIFLEFEYKWWGNEKGFQICWEHADEITVGVKSKLDAVANLQVPQ